MKRIENEEKELLKSYDRDEWVSTDNFQERRKLYQKYARSTFLKNKRINIRLSERDLINIKVKSLEEGIPYQSLISSVLHKYLTGRLVETE
jgi:predicted DNA binding CopG/RHH family protein